MGFWDLFGGTNEEAKWKARSETQEKCQAKIDAERANFDKILQDNVKQLQANAREKIQKLEEKKKQMAENFERDRVARENASLEERRQMTADFNRQMKEKTDEMEEVRNDLKKKEEELRAKHEKEMKEKEAQVHAEMNKRFEEAKANGEKVEKLILGHQNQLKSKDREYHALEREQFGLIQSKNVNQISTVSNFSATHVIVKQSEGVKRNIDSIKAHLSEFPKLIGELRGKIANWGFLSFFSSDSAYESILKSISNECFKLDGIIKDTFGLVSDPVFDQKSSIVEEANRILNIAQETITNLWTKEIFKVKETHSVDGIVDGLTALNRAFNNFPTMTDKTFHNCVQEELSKMKITLAEDGDRMINDVPAREGQPIPTIESP